MDFTLDEYQQEQLQNAAKSNKITKELILFIDDIRNGLDERIEELAKAKADYRSYWLLSLDNWYRNYDESGIVAELTENEGYMPTRVELTYDELFHGDVVKMAEERNARLAAKKAARQLEKQRQAEAKEHAEYLRLKEKFDK